MMLLKEIYSDYRRYRATGARSALPVLLLQGFWASCAHRLSHALLCRIHIPILVLFSKIILSLVNKGVEILTGISLPYTCHIGTGLYIGHFGPIILNGAVRLGSNCNLSQGVTIGVAGRGSNRGCPILGNRVYVGPNAILIGKIEIGDDAAIGAGAVVTKSIPPRGVAVGNPARVISYRGSFEFVLYDGMADDPARADSLLLAQKMENCR